MIFREDLFLYNCLQVESVRPDRYKKAGVPQFPAPCDGCEGVDWNGYSVRDVVKIPASQLIHTEWGGLSFVRF